MLKNALEVLVSAIICFSLSSGATNDAEDYCHKNDGRYEIYDDSFGAKYALCSFMVEDSSRVDGIRVSQCEAQSYFNDKCHKWDCLAIREITNIYDDNKRHLFCVNDAS